MKNKKNICFFSGDIFRSGGTERVGTLIANALSDYEKDYNIFILSKVTSKNKNPYFPINENIKLYSLSKKHSKSLLSMFFSIIKLRKFLLENKIDIIIDIDLALDLITIPATRGLKTKIISWEHFNFYHDMGNKWLKFIRRLSARYSNQIVTLTNSDRQNYLENLYIRGNIDYIYNPIYCNQDLICNPYNKQIITVGRLTFIKGIDLLCEVAKEILLVYTDWKWIILGDGEERTYLEKKIIEYGLEGKLILKGNIQNINEYYCNSSIYVMTSRNEGLPMVLLEAKQMSLPIVSFDCLSGPSEIIRDGINGYLIEPENLNEMIKKIEILIMNQEKRLKFSQQSKLDIEKFNLSNIIHKWIKIIEHL